MERQKSNKRDYPRAFLVRAGVVGEDEDYALSQGLAIIGFQEYGSLNNVEDFASLVKLVSKKRPELKPKAASNYAGQLRIFVGMKRGDLVILPRKLASQIAIGKVDGPYEYRRIGNSYRHTRRVRWVHKDIPRTAFGQDLLSSFGAFRTICRITRHDAERRIAAIVLGQPDPGEAIGNDRVQG